MLTNGGNQRKIPVKSVVAILSRPDDGMDRPALPVLPSPADAARAALYRDAHHRCGAARRSGAAAAFRCGRASAGVAAWRLRAARAGGLRADRRGTGL